MKGCHKYFFIFLFVAVSQARMRYTIGLKGMFKKFKDRLYEYCNLLEIIMALFVIIAIFIASISIIEGLKELIENRMEFDTFMIFLGTVFNVVIGIEFLKLLCKPSRDTLVEVLMFAISRQMIIEHSTPLGNLIVILSVAILFAVRRFFFVSNQDI